jgi:hypothetical protein
MVIAMCVVIAQYSPIVLAAQIVIDVRNVVACHDGPVFLSISPYLIPQDSASRSLLELVAFLLQQGLFGRFWHFSGASGVI